VDLSHKRLFVSHSSCEARPTYRRVFYFLRRLKQEPEMPDLMLYLAFITAVFILAAIPGPNVAIIVANSIAHGARYGVMTVAGTSTAMILQLTITVMGMAALQSALANWLEWLRWLGVIYLAYLAVRAWLAPTDSLDAAPEPRSVVEIYFRGFLVSLFNPKTLLFYGAFLPQFVSDDGPLLAQLMVLSASFLITATIVDTSWALLAARLGHVLRKRSKIRNRLVAGLMIGAGIGMVLAKRI
jgi:homoserine/homoserine lactone efflux protein